MYIEVSTFMDGVFDKKQRFAAFFVLISMFALTIIFMYLTPTEQDRLIQDRDATIINTENGTVIAITATSTLLLLPDVYFELPKNHTCSTTSLAIGDFTTWCSPYNEPKSY